MIVAGFNVSGFLWNDELELYYDITRNGEDVAFISKGWNDPGFRIAEMVQVPAERVAQLDEVRQYCNSNGVVFSVLGPTPSGVEVVLEQVIYSTGFDGRTLSLALSTLMKCSASLKHH